MAKKKIIAAVDLVHKTSDSKVVTEAISLAQTHDADVEVVFVIPDQQSTFAQTYIPADMRERVEVEAREELATYADGFPWGDLGHSTQVLHGVVYEKIIEHADQQQASFIVIGANRPTVADLFIGPNAARVSRHALCSVLVVR